jgi:hypothetical protein
MAGRCVSEGADVPCAEGWRGSNIGKQTKRLISLGGSLPKSQSAAFYISKEKNNGN